MSVSKPPKGGSGQHPAVIAFRKKLDSIDEHTVPVVDEVVEKIEKLKRDPRRDGDSEPPTDEVRPSTLPTPLPKAKK